MPVARSCCWSNFVANLDQWRQHLEHELGVACYQIDGRIPVDDGSKRSKYDDLDETREQVLHRFLTHDGPAVFITNPASCSESISLHHACHDAIYLDRTYDAALYLQSIDRIHRLGLPPGADVTIHPPPCNPRCSTNDRPPRRLVIDPEA